MNFALIAEQEIGEHIYVIDFEIGCREFFRN
jgi:hypothetical protein